MLDKNLFHFERLNHTWKVEGEVDSKSHRKIIHMKDNRNDIVNNVAFVQYAYNGEEGKVVGKPHQNSRKRKAPRYTRTKPSVVAKIDKKLSSSMGPKEAVYQSTQEAGGVINVDSMSDFPRGREKGYYRSRLIKQSLPSYLQGKEDDDELLQMILKMKTEKEPFVRKVTVEKDNVSILQSIVCQS